MKLLSTLLFYLTDFQVNISRPTNWDQYLGHDIRWRKGGQGTIGYSDRGVFRDVVAVPPLSNITVSVISVNKQTREVYRQANEIHTEKYDIVYLYLKRFYGCTRRKDLCHSNKKHVHRFIFIYLKNTIHTQASSHGGHSGAVLPRISFVPPQTFFVPRKIWFQNIIKTKIVPPKKIYFAPPNLKTRLRACPHFRITDYF